MAGVSITSGNGTTVAADNIGSPSAPTTGERVQYMKLDGGTAGSSAPLENATAANVASYAGAKALLTGNIGQWSITHAPAAATQATISKGAVASTRHVCTGFIVTVAGGVSAPTAALVTFNLRDGATGAGTILSTMTLAVAAVAGQCNAYAVTGLNIPGSVNTAMTVETSAATGSNVSASVTLMGYSLT